MGDREKGVEERELMRRELDVRALPHAARRAPRTPNVQLIVVEAASVVHVVSVNTTNSVGPLTFGYSTL